MVLPCWSGSCVTSELDAFFFAVDALLCGFAFLVTEVIGFALSWEGDDER